MWYDQRQGAFSQKFSFSKEKNSSEKLCQFSVLGNTQDFSHLVKIQWNPCELGSLHINFDLKKNFENFLIKMPGLNKFYLKYTSLFWSIYIMNVLVLL